MNEGPLLTLSAPMFADAPFQHVVDGNRITLLHQCDQALPSMLRAIEEARSEVLLEMYWFASDSIGQKFAAALSAKAKEGVNVQVLYDAVGSWGTDPQLFEAMRRAGCQVREYHPVAPLRKHFRLGLVNNRDHRKILVVDGIAAMTGGVNIGDQWMPVSQGGEGWRDDIIWIEGPAATHFRTVFTALWRRQGHPRVKATQGTEGRISVLANGRFGNRRGIRREYLNRIRGAEHYIFITNSYFVPDKAVRISLAHAAARGVDVRVLLPARSDVPAVAYASHHLYDWLLGRGIRIYEWQRSILHAKSAVVDGAWCTTGTFNLDYRSFRLNLEVNVSIADVAVAGAMRRQFEKDLASSSTVQRETWAQRSSLTRALESLAFAFRKVL